MEFNFQNHLDDIMFFSYEEFQCCQQTQYVVLESSLLGIRVNLIYVKNNESQSIIFSLLSIK